MTDRNKNRSGYKETPVGWIPGEWDCVPIRQTGTVVTGATPTTANPDYYGGRHFFVAPGDLDQGFRIHSSKISLSDSGWEQVRPIPKGAVLFVCIGSTIGKVATAACNLATNQQINSLVPDLVHSGDFLFYTLLHDNKRIASLAACQAVPILNKTQFESVRIPLPPLPEQKKIAEILSTWDEAIEQTRALIVAAKRRKKALMQQLLTGKKRLPGFGSSGGRRAVATSGPAPRSPEGWRIVHLDDVFVERNECDSSHLPLLAITRERGIIPAAEVDKKDSSPEDKSLYKRIVPGDIGYNTMRMWQGVSAVSMLEGIVSPAYTVCIPGSDIDAIFAGYLFKFSPVIYLFWRHSQGLVDDTLNLKYHNFARIQLPLPPLPEQRAIAAILTAADKEIESMEAKSVALERQKKGLMQKLLTGEIRVKV